MSLDTIPKSMQKDVIATYWLMMRELDTKADNDDDVLLKHIVEGCYRQWNQMTGTDHAPSWVVRAARTEEV